MKQIKVGIKLDKTGFQKELNDLLKNGYDINLNNGNFKNAVNDITKELEKLKASLGNFTNNSFEGTTKGAVKAKTQVKELNTEINKVSNGNLTNKTKIIDSSGVTEINKYSDSIAKATTETIKNGQVTKQVFSENINVITKLQNDLGNKLNTASSNGLINTSVIDGLKTKLNSINTDTSTKEVEELKTAINNLASSDSAVVRLQNSISNMQSKLSNAKGKYGELVNKDDISKALIQINELKKALADVTSGKSISSTKISSIVNNASKSIKDLTTNAKNSGSALRLAQTEVVSYGSAISRAFGNVGIFLTTATAMRQLWSGIKEGISYVKSLDDAFFNISATMSITETQFKNVTTQVQQMAKDMGISAESVMQVVQTYANNTTDLNEVLQKAQGSVILSNITGMDTSEVTKAVNSAVNAFKMMDEEGSTATGVVERFGDSLVKISQNMNYDFGDGVTEIISGIKEAGSVAEMSGVSLESYASILGAVTEATGKTGSEIGNAFKMISARTLKITSLADDLEITTEEMGDAGRALSDFGIHIEDTGGNLRNLDDILLDVANIWGNLTDSEKQYLSENVAG